MTWTVGIVGALVMGFGMSKIMVGTTSTTDVGGYKKSKINL